MAVPVIEVRLSPGDVVLVTRRASVQFVTPVTFRVIRVVSEWVTFDGWVWLHGYMLDAQGNAVTKRDLFVQPAGLHLVRRAGGPAPRPRNQRPAYPASGADPTGRAARAAAGSRATGGPGRLGR